MGTFADITQLFAAGYGWVFIGLILVWQLYAPTLLGWDTALAPLVRDVPEKVNTLEDHQEDLKGDMDDVKEQQKVQMQVQRAQARANPQMNEERVDSYLLENGVEPNEFLKGDEMSGFENWRRYNEDNSDD